MIHRDYASPLYPFLLLQCTDPINSTGIYLLNWVDKWMMNDIAITAGQPIVEETFQDILRECDGLISKLFYCESDGFNRAGQQFNIVLDEFNRAGYTLSVTLLNSNKIMYFISFNTRVIISNYLDLPDIIK